MNLRINNILNTSCTVILFLKLHTVGITLVVSNLFFSCIMKTMRRTKLLKYYKLHFLNIQTMLTTKVSCILQFVLVSSLFSFVACSSKYIYRNSRKKVEEHAHTSVMAAKYLRLKVAEKKVEKMKLCYDGKNLTLFKVTESSAVFSHLRQVPCFSLSNSLDQSKTVVVYQKILLY